MGGKLNLLTGKWEEDKPKRKRPEASVGHAVDAYLRKLHGYVRTINSGGTMRNGKWTTSQQGAGIPDRLCWLPGGKFIAIELKAPGKKRTVSDAQYLFLRNIIYLGHKGCVADCVEDVARALSMSQMELLQALEALRPKKESPDPASLRPLFED
jgi:hypothetical protein